MDQIISFLIIRKLIIFVKGGGVVSDAAAGLKGGFVLGGLLPTPRNPQRSPSSDPAFRRPTFPPRGRR